MGNEMGKRYKCEQCGAEAMVTKPGDGTVECCGEAMAPVSAPGAS